MPYRLFVDAEQRFARIEVEGALTVPLVEESLGELLAHPEFGPSYRQLVDWSRVDRVELSAADVRELLGRSLAAAPRAGHARIAFVAPLDLAYGIARMFELMGGKLPYDVAVFRSVAEAMDWLGPVS